MNLISIEGNIGSGKSTLLKKLQGHFAGNPNVVFIKEPVDEWIETKDAAGHNIIEKYYANQEKYAFPFQTLAYISKLKLLKDAYKANPHAIFISERSLYTDRFVFAKMLFEMGKMEDICYTIYLNWFDYFIEEMRTMHRVIYVNTDPQICYERVQLRNRSGEEPISLDYLTTCDNYHRVMLDTTNPACPLQEQFVIEGNLNRPDESPEWSTILTDVEAFIIPRVPFPRRMSNEDITDPPSPPQKEFCVRCAVRLMDAQRLYCDKCRAKLE